MKELNFTNFFEEHSLIPSLSTVNVFEVKINLLQILDSQDYE